MTNPYNMNAYAPQLQNAYYNATGLQPQKSSGLPVVGLATLGFLGGGTAGYLKNRYPVSKDGTVSDTFAKNAFENHVNKNYTKEKKQMHQQVKKFLDKANDLKTVEDFKKFLKANSELSEACAKGINTTTEEFINSMTSSNFSNTKNALKDMFNKQNSFNIEQFKSFTQSCWDKEAKKFVKTDGISDNIFKVIKNTTANSQWKSALKYGGITAGVTGLLAIVCNMFISSKQK